MAPLANRLRELRLGRGLSQSAVARLVHTTPAQIGRLEKGERQLTQKWLERLGRALQCQPADLLPLPSATPPLNPPMMELRLLPPASKAPDGQPMSAEETVLLDAFRELAKDQRRAALAMFLTLGPLARPEARPFTARRSSHSRPRP